MGKLKNIKKQPVLSIILYVFSIIAACYALYTMYASYSYISSLIKAGSIVVGQQLPDIINYYVNASMPYVFYALGIWAIGYMISKLTEIQKSLNPVEEDTVVKIEKEEK